MIPDYLIKNRIQILFHQSRPSNMEFLLKKEQLRVNPLNEFKRNPFGEQRRA